MAQIIPNEKFVIEVHIKTVPNSSNEKILNIVILLLQERKPTSKDMKSDNKQKENRATGMPVLVGMS